MCILLDGKTREINGYTFHNLLCYDDWVEGRTAGEVQHVLGDGMINFCLEHSSKC